MSLYYEIIIFLDLTLKDPYESKTIEIKKSNIPGAAEGIFVIKVNNISFTFCCKDILCPSFKIYEIGEVCRSFTET